MTRRRRWMSGLLAWLLLGLATPAWAAPSLTALDFTERGPGRLDVELRFSGGVPQVNGYQTAAPPRLALDLLDTTSALAQNRFALAGGGVESLRVLAAPRRTRLVFALDEALDYRLERLADRLVVHLGAAPAASTNAATPAPGFVAEAGREAPGVSHVSATSTSRPRVEALDFRRSDTDHGELLVTLDRPGVAASVSGSGRQVTLTLPDVVLPDAQYQTLDVSDFGTAVTRIVPRRDAGGVSFEISATRAVEPLVTQNGRELRLELAPQDQGPRAATSASAPGATPSYSGKPVTLDFQDIPVRDVLSIIAQVSGLNVVASDSVQGNVTLNLVDVPWDQALDLVLQSRGLAARRTGDVMVVAPAGELASLQRQTLESREQSQQLAPLVTEFVPIRYAKADTLAGLLRGGEGVGLMSERGRVTVDVRTNTLILQDTRDQLEAIRRTIEQLDVPVRQVQIEARIVIARDSATRELGVNWGMSSPAGGRFNLSGAADGDPSSVPTTSDDPQSYGGGLAVDLGNATQPASAFSFGYLSGDVLIDLELRALESEGKSQTISQPKVITANQRTAVIKQGQEVPYQEASSSGATTTEFKEAVLSLEVTPQITPDDRIIMDLRVNNDDISDTRFDGAPAIDTNEIQTQVLVDNGETVVLGGILTSEQLHTLFKTPFLGDIPVIGQLFRYTQESNEKVELLIFITPKIIEDRLAIR
ncbi:type IV pilus secretin PilQ [Salinicola sp. JS01]|uniref:type IV pilus secretin PilQ n=1 Tax=Salinicola sp. JS01 TaxID=3050071 RepID=UPI00255B8020|nr:type IV pilus secretin PilQ [Salinicola sp. JS01]WIX31942.1 type IV pilus secretin PilQ [Salinicola sp. JS01]